jgi:hypothetical protein
MYAGKSSDWNRELSLERLEVLCRDSAVRMLGITTSTRIFADHERVMLYLNARIHCPKVVKNEEKIEISRYIQTDFGFYTLFMR